MVYLNLFTLLYFLFNMTIFIFNFFQEKNLSDDDKSPTPISNASSSATTAPPVNSSSASAETSSGNGGTTTSASTALPAAPFEAAVNQEHLQQLMDMGFSRELCIDALLSTNSMDLAADYCLTHPAPLGVPTSQSSGNAPDAASQPPSSRANDFLSSLMIQMGRNPNWQGASQVQPTSDFMTLENKTTPAQQPPTPIDPNEVNQFLGSIFNGSSICLYYDLFYVHK